MIISVNWLKQYTDISLPINELATLIGARLVEIEEVKGLGEKYKDAVIVKVVECGKLEGSDHLNVTKVDDGGYVEDVERDENGFVQVVCGAPNVYANMMAVWLPPKTVVPETVGSDEPFVLGVRKMMGVTSNGMLASAKELDLYDDHNGIIEAFPTRPGTLFRDAYQLDDYLFDIENKSLTHRPDAFGVLGFAREVAGIQGTAFTTPNWLANVSPTFAECNTAEAPSVTIDDPTLSDRYQGIVLEGIETQNAEMSLTQSLLARSGMRPISAIVDVTNYLMLLTGQPLHAFDYDKLLQVGGGKVAIHVRSGHANETLTLLDGRTIELDSNDIVIANGETAVALAGAMGGAETEIDASTKRIFLESATFNLYKLRATQMRHGIFSEAITRFTKGQPAALTAPVLAEAVHLMSEWANAKLATNVVEAYPGKSEPIRIHISTQKINDTLGTTYDAKTIEKTLTNVEFGVEANDKELIVTVPYWRGDIHIDEDVIEEVGRLNGFDTITPTLPRRDFVAISPTAFDQFRTRLRQQFVRAGANEVLSYSFVHGNVLKKAQQMTDDSYKIVNSISPDLQYYRQSLLSSLLGLVNPNLRAGFDEFALFELNKVHLKSRGLTDEHVPLETHRTAMVLASRKDKTTAFYRAKKILNYIAKEVEVELRYRPLTDGSEKIFEPKRSADIVTADGQVLGVLGEFKRSIQNDFKLPPFSAGFELDTEKLFAVSLQAKPHYTPLSRFPGTERDVCFQVNDDTSYQQVHDAMSAVLASVNLETTVEPLDLYKADETSTKNITVRVKLTSHKQTLTGEQATKIVDTAANKVATELNATII